jgi:hypothetical protein
MSTVVRFHMPDKKVHVQRAESGKATRRLYSYAVRVATEEALIELVVDGLVEKSHQVVYTPGPTEKSFAKAA